MALAIYGGIYAWIQLKADEDIQQTDIYEAIPTYPDMMLIVHKPALLPEVWNICGKFSNLLPEKKSLVIVDAIGKSQICSEHCMDKEPLIISYYPEGTLLFSRMKLKDFEYMEKKFFKVNLSGFMPKKEAYKDAEINIKATGDNASFFCYTLYHNIFIGSFEKKLIYKAIDARIQQSGLRNDSTFRETIEAFNRFDKNVLSGLYLYHPKKSFIFKKLTSDTSEHWLTGDIKFRDQVMEISGFFPANERDTLSVDSIFTPCVEDSIRYADYTFRLFISPNHPDKFYSLSITREP